MKKLLTILAVLISIFALAQDAKPVDANLKTLQSPNNVIWYYNTSTQKIGMWKGAYLYNEFFSAKKLQFKIDSLKTHADTKYGDYYENEVTVAGTTSYILPYQLRAKSQVWYNGVLLRPAQWNGIGTIYISISGDIRVKDYFTVVF